MAQFKVRGENFAIDRFICGERIAKMSEQELKDFLVAMTALEVAYVQGVLTCSESDWEEIHSISITTARQLSYLRNIKSLANAKAAAANMQSMDSFLKSCGIYLEVR